MATIEVLVQHGALQETALRGGTIVLRGVIHPKSLIDPNALHIDEYQRNDMGRRDILKALEEEAMVPDIELGMRGEHFRSVKETFHLQDPVYIIDGLQRVSAARRLLDKNPEAPISIGALIHFGTDRLWEQERFEVMNRARRKVAPSVILKNRRESRPAILTLYGLTEVDRNFPLFGRVCWSQDMARNHLMPAMSLAKTAGALHSQFATTLSTQFDPMIAGLDAAAKAISLNMFRQNVSTFFNLVEECWGIRKVEYRHMSVQIKSTFIWTLARLLSDHEDFWTEKDGRCLVIEPSLRRKLKQFQLTDPNVMRLAGASGQARLIFYGLLLQHINSGKRTRRLTRRLIAADVEKAVAA